MERTHDEAHSLDLSVTSSLQWNEENNAFDHFCCWAHPFSKMCPALMRDTMWPFLKSHSFHHDISIQNNLAFPPSPFDFEMKFVSSFSLF